MIALIFVTGILVTGFASTTTLVGLAAGFAALGAVPGVVDAGALLGFGSLAYT